MASVLLLISVILASLICVRAGAVALELTGMDQDKARFQALSAFTNTGFTTREAEDITNFPVRRKIITILIILGRAGTVTFVATFAVSMLQRDPQLALFNFGIIIMALYIIYRLARSRGLTERMRHSLRKWLVKRYDIQTASIEEMLKVGEGLGVVRVSIPKNSPLASRPLADLGLKAQKVQVLSILRGEQAIAVPQGSDSLRAGDTVICYGNIEAAKKLFPPEKS